MKTVLLLGLGRSTHTLVKYLAVNSKRLNINLVLADYNHNNFIQSFINTCFPFYHHILIKKEYS